MTRRGIIASLTAVALITGLPVTARADDPPVPPISGYLRDDSAAVWATDAGKSSDRAVPVGARQTVTSYQPVCVSEGEEVLSSGRCRQANTMCVAGSVPMWVVVAPARPAPAAEDWVNTGRVVCRGGADAAAPVVLSAAQFRRLPIPAARIVAQPDPADRPTLVGVETNLLTDRRVETLTTTVLGRPVRVRATPTSYHWHYGDGTERTTARPGGRYPTMPTAHVYRRAGTFAVRLATTFSGEYSVAGGPWTPVDGTATVEGPGVTVEAVEGHAHLVS